MKQPDFKERADALTPDVLMEHFRGKGFTSMIAFTLLVHVVVIGGLSIPYLIRTVTGANTTTMTKEERVDEAVREATVKLRALAETYNISPQDISQRFTAGSSKPVPPPAAKPATTEQPTPVTPESAPSTNQTAAPKSAIEKEIEVSKPGPVVPPVDNDPF
jgi:cytoskeletal protein RodZ